MSYDDGRHVKNEYSSSDTEIYKIRIDESNWARCGRCGHKLYELLGENGQLRIKCHSCKSINETC